MCIRDSGRPVDEKQRREVHAGAGLARDLVDDEDVANGDLLLAAAGADDRVHVELTFLQSFSGMTAHPRAAGAEALGNPVRGGRTDSPGYRVARGRSKLRRLRLNRRPRRPSR